MKMTWFKERSLSIGRMMYVGKNDDGNDLKLSSLHLEHLDSGRVEREREMCYSFGTSSNVLKGQVSGNRK